MRRLRRPFFARDAVVVARELLGKVLIVGDCSGRIVETEAYRQDDPASHSHRGLTPRNSTMFDKPGSLYVYFTYGMHHCSNVVTGPVGEGSAVLIRAVEPLTGVEIMRARRPAARRAVDISNGPGKVCEAFALDRAANGIDLTTSATIMIADDGTLPPLRPGVSARVGIRVGRDLYWRFYVPGNPSVGRTPRYEAEATPSGLRTSRP